MSFNVFWNFTLPFMIIDYLLFAEYNQLSYFYLFLQAPVQKYYFRLEYLNYFLKGIDFKTFAKLVDFLTMVFSLMHILNCIYLHLNLLSDLKLKKFNFFLNFELNLLFDISFRHYYRYHIWNLEVLILNFSYFLELKLF